MSGEGGFDRRIATVVAVLAVASFLFAVVASILAPEPEQVESYLSTPYSRSAVGQHAFVELLRGLGRGVLVSRSDSGRRAAAQDATLALLEPLLIEPGRESHLRELLQQAPVRLLVLPKWTGREGEQAGFLATAGLIPSEEANRVLRVAEAPAVVKRLSAIGSCSGGLVPRLRQPQLLQPLSASLLAKVDCGDGVLIAAMQQPNGLLVVVSDPDLLANHGLRQGDNARLALLAVDEAGPKRGLVVDVTLHGLGRPPSLYRELLQFPLLLAVIHAALGIAILAAASLPRFGAPLPETPVAEPGKAVLIRNTAELLAQGGRHAGWLLERYFDGALRDAARALHGPQRASRAELVDFLQRLAPQSGVALLAGQTQRAAEQGEGVLAVAARIHRFREEIALGPSRNP